MAELAMAPPRTLHPGTGAPSSRACVDLAGVSETMLWTLHDRASDAKRADARLKDPGALRIHEQIAYDYEKSFGIVT
jgi:hypothetical protein